MNEPLDIITAFKDVDQNLEGVVKVIAKDESVKSKVKEIIVQHLASVRGSSPTIEKLSLSALRFPNGEVEIDFCIAYERIRGYYTITEWQPSMVKASLVDRNIRFDVKFTYNIDVTVYHDINPDRWSKPTPKSAGKSRFAVWSYQLDVPLELITYWMENRYGEPDYIVTSTEGNDIAYGTGEYPIRLLRYFFSAGKQAFDIFKDQGIMSAETYAIVKDRFSWFFEEPVLNSPAQPQQGGKVMSNPTAQTPSPSYEEQLVAIRMDDRRRLASINTLAMPHSIREWQELLAFNSPGSTAAFIERMEKAGHIKVEKTADGTVLKLTENTRRILKE